MPGREPSANDGCSSDHQGGCIVVTTEEITLLARLRARLFPRMPDFHGMLSAQCDLVVEGTETLVAYMRDGRSETAERVAEIEHEADRLKKRNIDVLQRAFTTPFDREDVYRAIVSIDEILNYAKSTVREMEQLHLPPDEHTLAMALQLEAGATAMARGFQMLHEDPEAADSAAEQARKTERATEKLYRSALAELFDASHYLETQTPAQRDDVAGLDVLVAPLADPNAATLSTGIGFVLEILKRREVYRHMSNAADRVARAADVLHDIVVKLV
jgi:uncharacterized protein Yka (UPF0111/DUF47 family)